MSTALTTIETDSIAPQAYALIAREGGFESLPKLRNKKHRTAVLAKVQAMLDIEAMQEAGTSVKAACTSVSRRLQGTVKVSAKTLDNAYRVWRKGGTSGGIHYAPRDWKMFIPRWTNGNRKAALSNDTFREHVMRNFADTCREDATGNALRERLLDAWFGGEEVPGFGTIYSWSAAQGRPVPDLSDPLARSRSANIPEGWSADNLRRLLPRSTATRRYIQRGEHAAHDH